MANTQTSVPLYASGEVLTAANMNISAGTGIPVFATTVTRDAAFGGANEKVLAEGQYAYIEASNVTQYYDGSAWQSVGASGLTLVSSTTIGSAVSSVTVTGAFSATYDNYLVLISGGVMSATSYMSLTLGSASTGYYYVAWYAPFTAPSFSFDSGSNAASFIAPVSGTTNTLDGTITIKSPFLSKRTVVNSSRVYTSTSGSNIILGGFIDDNTSYTAFTLTASGTTVTGGTIKVYGYANS